VAIDFQHKSIGLLCARRATPRFELTGCLDPKIKSSKAFFWPSKCNGGSCRAIAGRSFWHLPHPSKNFQFPAIQKRVCMAGISAVQENQVEQHFSLLGLAARLLLIFGGNNGDFGHEVRHSNRGVAISNQHKALRGQCRAGKCLHGQC
jgi:hypothetical protein